MLSESTPNSEERDMAWARFADANPKRGYRGEEYTAFRAGWDAVIAAGYRPQDGEVLVEGSYFAVGDLPKILGNFMRSSAEYAREVKSLTAQLAEARLDLDKRLEHSDHLTAKYYRRMRDAERAALATTGGDNS